MRRLALTALLAALAFATTASAKQYILKHPKHEHCRAHYVRKVEKVKRRERGHTVKVRETVCVYVPPKPSIGVLPSITAKPVTTVAPAATTAIPAPSFTFHAKLDPSFTQDAANPLDVTYDYSASADKLTNGVSLGEPDLPSGVIELYNEGLLACSMNVGGSTGEGECPVTYLSYGEHTVVVLYLSGEASATSGNETERIEPPAVTDRESWQPTSASMTITRSTAQVIVSGIPLGSAGRADRQPRRLLRSGRDRQRGHLHDARDRRTVEPHRRLPRHHDLARRSRCTGRGTSRDRRMAG